MAEFDRLERLERDLAAALAEVDRLKALEAIRDCVYRVCRAIDRIDEDRLCCTTSARSESSFI